MMNSLYRCLRKVAAFGRQYTPPRQLPGVPGGVHVKDPMLYDESEESIGAYLRAASSAMDNIKEGLRLAGSSCERVRSCLDFGCGYGRVLRLLSAAIKRQRITACDVDAEAVRFCAREFGVRPLVSSPRIREVRFGSYDLIWAGSVVTHVEDADCNDMLQALGNALWPGGVLLFSTHGRFSYDNLEHLYGGFYAAEAEQIRREVAEHGISYRPYEEAHCGYGRGSYGVTWHARDSMVQRLTTLFGESLKLLAFRPQGWDNHHDVYIYQKVTSTSKASLRDLSSQNHRQGR